MKGSAIAMVVSLLALPGLIVAGERITWKPAGEAILRIDDRPPKHWNVYQTEKNNDLVLVQIGQRFLLLNTRRRQVYELDPSKLAQKDKNLIWEETEKPTHSLASDHWYLRDVGLAWRIRVRLSEEGRVLDLQLPHPVDIRTLY